jgi:hypothetical protein
MAPEALKAALLWALLRAAAASAGGGAYLVSMLALQDGLWRVARLLASLL